MQVCCSIECALSHAQAKREKAARVEHIAAKERIKTRGEWAREAQAAFNAWIRERDKAMPCISCQRHHAGQYHAGHYRSVGSNPALRFDPLNVHKQCSVCNNHRSGNLTEYRINLLQKIGQEALNWLEGPHEPKKYSIDDLRKIRDEYRLKLRQVKKCPQE
jgi:hypothetical protein